MKFGDPPPPNKKGVGGGEGFPDPHDPPPAKPVRWSSLDSIYTEVVCRVFVSHREVCTYSSGGGGGGGGAQCGIQCNVRCVPACHSPSCSDRSITSALTVVRAEGCTHCATKAFDGMGYDWLKMLKIKTWVW